MSDATDDFLAHYGVKGMKWGKKKSKPSSDDVKSARERHNSRIDEIHKLDSTAANARTKKERTEAVNKMRDLAKKTYDSSDKATALKATSGEKAASLLLAGPFGPVVISASMKAQAKSVDYLLNKAQDVTVEDYGKYTR